MAHDEWMTPKWVIDFVKRVAGIDVIDLDPCSTKEANQIVGARKFYTKEQNGLEQSWGSESGFIWCNPPYSDPLPWVLRMSLGHADNSWVNGYRGAILMNATTETRAGQLLLENANYIWFPERRVQFVPPQNLQDTYKSSSNRCGQMIGFFNLYIDSLERQFGLQGIWMRSI